MVYERTSVVRVEHSVPDYEAWKREAFDHDPLGRERSGVRRYRVLRADDDPGLVAIELEFDSRSLATAFVGELAGLWRGVAERFGWTEAPKVRIFELSAAEEYRG
jgi:hypothetical protein